jgi:DNA polymerase-3 subunit alpha
MGKKKPEEMMAQRDRFLSGTDGKHIDRAKANHIFDLMEKFAGYGFNKSHSAAYALIAYQTAYLKAHYTVELMAALLNSFLSSGDQVVRLINECGEKKIEILPPDVNASQKDFSVVEGRIRFGLGAVKNVGETAVEMILQSRDAEGPFRSIHDFCQRVDSQKVNRRVIEQLIRCGAFDSLHSSRARVFAALDDAMDRAQVYQRDRASGQMNIFDLLKARKNAAPAPARLPDVPEWDSGTKLQYEKESLGFYISGHPLDLHADQIAQLCATRTSSAQEHREGAEIILCGVLTVIKELTTKKGDRMAFLSLEDKEGSIEVVSFSDTYLQAKDLVDADAPVVVIGRVQHDEKGTKIIAGKVLSLEDAQVQTVDSVHIHLRSDTADHDALTRLRHLLMTHPGECRTILHLNVDGKAEAVIALSPKLQVSPTSAFLEEMAQHFGRDCLKTVLKTCQISSN